MLANIEGVNEFYKFTAAQLPMSADSEVLNAVDFITESNDVDGAW